MTSISDVVDSTTTFHEPRLCGKTLTIKVAILRPGTQGPCAVPLVSRRTGQDRSHRRERPQSNASPLIIHASAGLTSCGMREPLHLPPWRPRPRKTCSLPSPMRSSSRFSEHTSRLQCKMMVLCFRRIERWSSSLLEGYMP